MKHTASSRFACPFCARTDLLKDIKKVYVRVVRGAIGYAQTGNTLCGIIDGNVYKMNDGSSNA